jgi:hypothetical protein
MKTIKQLIKNKPSIAVRAMVDGLKKTINRSTFFVEMGSFGCSGYLRGMMPNGFYRFKSKRAVKSIDTERKVCFGCAATCTLQQIAQKNFTTKTINNRYCEFDRMEQTNFQFAMDDVRKGYFLVLFMFCGIPYSPKYNGYFSLSTANWLNELPEVEKVIKMLESDGL